MEIKIRAKAVSLLEGFISRTDGTQYVIPVYQRNYTWKKLQVNALLDDIEQILNNKKEWHFIGSIVHIETANDGVGSSERSIIDGQQRLTTIFLLLFAIRDYFKKKKDDENIKKFTEECLENVNTKDLYKLRLKPPINNDELFKKIAASEDISSYAEKHINLYDNFIIVSNKINKWIEDGKTINDIKNAINNLYIVSISLGKDDNPQQIFASINSTGDRLQQADLIRNYILMNKNDQEQTEYYNNYWKKIEENSKNNPEYLEEFFRFYLASKQFNLHSKKNIYFEFTSFFEEQKIKKTEKEILDDILQFSIYYFDLKHNDVYKFDGIKNYRKIDSDVPLPFLMGLYNEYKINNISKEDFSKCLTLISGYLIRRHMCGLETGPISRFFPSLLKNVIKTFKKEKNNVVEILKFYLVNKNSQKSIKMPKDEEIEYYLKNNNAYSLKSTRVFFEIFELCNLISINLNDLTIEHIMPQTSTPYWQKKANTEDEEVYNNLVNSIGNLTLAHKITNSSMQNKDFQSKKKELEKIGKIDLTKDVLNKTEWTFNEINERTDNLIKKFVELFPFFDSKKNYDETKLIILNMDGVDAKARLSKDESLELLSGSEIKKNVRRHQAEEKILNELINDELVEDLGEKYKLKEDLEFQSISGATKLICGGSQNGWIHWKDENGIILDDKENGLRHTWIEKK